MNYLIETTDTFDSWLLRLKDIRARQNILLRLRRIEQGNFGDYKSVGGGISELRINIGKGYRVYYTIRQRTIVFVLGGGDKTTQQKDIQTALKIKGELT